MPALQPFEETELVAQCRAGDEDAWGLLIHHYGAGVRCALCRHLGAWAADWSLVEDLAACFWEELWMQRARRLRVYNPRRGRLATYLDHLVQWQVQRWRRACGRHEEQPREKPLPPHELPAPGAPCYPVGVFRDEVAALLTPRERWYLDYLCGTADADGACALSDSNRWKLDERVGRKASALLGCPR
jgi:hypothetical protein